MKRIISILILLSAGMVSAQDWASAPGTVMESNGIVVKPAGFWSAQVNDSEFSSAVNAAVLGGGSGSGGVNTNTVIILTQEQMAAGSNAVAAASVSAATGNISAITAVTVSATSLSGILSANNLTSGTLPSARIADASITTNKIDATFRDWVKSQSGTATNGYDIIPLSAIPAIIANTNYFRLMSITNVGPVLVNTNTASAASYKTNKIVTVDTADNALNVSIAAASVYFNSNLPPAAPLSPGQIFQWNSNGFKIYYVTSEGTSAWVATNAAW